MTLGTAVDFGLKLVAGGEEASGLSGVQVLLAVIGFMVAFAAGIICEPIRHCLFRPKLALEYDKNNGSKLIVKGTAGGHDTEFCFLRVRVTNKNLTRQIARSCVAYLTNVGLERTDTAEHFVESLPMAWSYRTKGIPSRAVKMGVEEPPPPEERIDVPCGLTPFFDILRTHKGDSQFSWCFACGEPNVYRALTNQHGVFTLTLMVSAENTAPAKIRLRFTWPGDWRKFGVEVV